MSPNVSGLPNPKGWRAVCPLLANGVTDQGLGEVSAANEAGNPVLADVGPHVNTQSPLAEKSPTAREGANESPKTPLP